MFVDLKLVQNFQIKYKVPAGILLFYIRLSVYIMIDDTSWLFLLDNK